MSLDGRKILIGVSGGIAAYKAVLLLRLLRRSGCEVRVVMTPSATEFVGPITFESLSEHPVHVHLFEGDEKSGGTISPVEHIDLARWPDLVVVAPATANTIAGFAHGRADDLLATLVSACEAPIVLAPAMNDVMWVNPANQENLLALGNRGFHVVDPEEGDLACGYEAKGRMAEPETIHRRIEAICAAPMAGRRVLVTVGGTEEDIDAVRVIANRSSGRMGFAVARAASESGAAVTCVVARTTVSPPPGVRVVRVRTTAELAAEVEREFDRCDALVMAAAVADYRPTRAIDGKKKGGDSWALDLQPTADILASLGERKGSRCVVGFAVETDDVEANARAKMRRKSCDLMVVNNPRTPGAAFEHETNVVTVYGPSGEVYRSESPESKLAIARRLVRMIAGTSAR